MKDGSSWYSERVQDWVHLVRWGHWGTPVLIFPTAGGDAEEIERKGLIGTLWPLIAGGRIKVYALDSIAGRAWLEKRDPRHCTWLQNQFDAVIANEVLAAIRTDCRNHTIENVTAGASFGAFTALATLCRHPDAVRAGIGLSGTYDLSPWLRGHFDDDFFFSSPWHYLPGLGESWQLDVLRRRLALFVYGGGRWEDPGQSWHMADLMGAKGIPQPGHPLGARVGPRLAALAGGAAALPRRAGLKRVRARSAEGERAASCLQEGSRGARDPASRPAPQTRERAQALVAPAVRPETMYLRTA